MNNPNQFNAQKSYLPTYFGAYVQASSSCFIKIPTSFRLPAVAVKLERSIHVLFIIRYISCSRRGRVKVIRTSWTSSEVEWLDRNNGQRIKLIVENRRPFLPDGHGELWTEETTWKTLAISRTTFRDSSVTLKRRPRIAPSVSIGESDCVDRGILQCTIEAISFLICTICTRQSITSVFLKEPFLSGSQYSPAWIPSTVC